ncbi:MAG: helix-turn-helix domain-containing protein, partial [Oligoflexia bacterium]|nr:helix-turn-helix domain-containing protein [Oligoflexia bacterium]
PGDTAAAWLASVGLTRADGSVTKAAALLFGRPGVLAALLPRGIVDLRVMHTPASGGIPRHRWDDRRFCDGNIVAALRTLFERFHTLCPQPFELEEQGPHRRARSREEEALREALVNLLAHQDYSDQSRIATVLWWRDRIVFQNPGDSFVPVELLASGGHSLLRNPLIAKLLRQADLAEQAGTGLPLMLDTWRQAGRPELEIRNDPASKTFEIGFPWGVYAAGEPVNDGVSEPVSGTMLSERAATVLAIITASPGLRGPRLVDRSGTSRATVRRALGELLEAGLVRFKGAPKTGGYYATHIRDAEQDA